MCADSPVESISRAHTLLLLTRKGSLSVAGSQVWDSTVLNGDDMSLFFSLGDTTKPKGATKSQTQRLAPQQIFQVTDQEDCSGPNCHF